VALSNNIKYIQLNKIALSICKYISSGGGIFSWAKMMSIKPTVARFSVASKKPPKLTDTIILADRVHAALVSLSNGSSIGM